MTRQCLPNRRLAETFELEVAGLRYTCAVGRFDDGRLAEVFLSNHKSNSAPDTGARESAIVFSIAVQCGSQGHASSPLGTALDLIAVAEVAGVGLPRGATTSRRLGPEGNPMPPPGPYR